MVTLYANKIIRLVHATLCDGPQSRLRICRGTQTWMLALKGLAMTWIGHPFFILALPPVCRTFPVDTTSSVVYYAITISCDWWVIWKKKPTFINIFYNLELYYSWRSSCACHDGCQYGDIHIEHTFPVLDSYPFYITGNVIRILNSTY